MNDEATARAQAIAFELTGLSPEDPPSLRLSAAFRAYSNHTGIELSDPPTVEERKVVRDWLVQMELELPSDPFGYSDAVLSRTRARSFPMVHTGATAKANWLRQRSCWTCDVDASVSPFRVDFGVPIPPFSAQSLAADKLRTIKDDIKANVEGRFDAAVWSDVALCVTVVSVLPTKSKPKDVDNLVKGFLDSLQGAIYDNDLWIHHLSAHKITNPGTAGHYLVTIRRVYDNLDGVVDLVEPLKWA